MFSDHLKKVKRFPRVNLLVVSGGLVIVCQLAAMGMVADEQVQRAGVRDLQRAKQRLALADCIHRSTGPVRHGCISQSSRESSAEETAQAKPAGERLFFAKNVASVAIADESVANTLPEMIRAGAGAGAGAGTGAGASR
jgi:hypothetical protein